VKLNINDGCKKWIHNISVVSSLLAKQPTEKSKKRIENRINIDIIKINYMDVLLMEIAEVQELALNIQILLSQIRLVGWLIG
jgi:hypothetical protein